MSRQTKQVFSLDSAEAFPQQTLEATKDLGIEFVHFDNDDNPESQHIVPLGKFISDTPLSSEEYIITRSLVAANASIYRIIVHYFGLVSLRCLIACFDL